MSKKKLNPKIVYLITLFGLVTLLICAFAIKQLLSNKNVGDVNFQGRKTIYVAANYGIGGICSFRVYTESGSPTRSQCIDESTISLAYLTPEIKRNLNDYSSSGRQIYAIDADIRQVLEERVTGNPNSGNKEKLTVTYLDKVYRVKQKGITD